VTTTVAARQGQLDGHRETAGNRGTGGATGVRWQTEDKRSWVNALGGLQVLHNAVGGGSSLEGIGGPCGKVERKQSCLTLEYGLGDLSCASNNRGGGMSRFSEKLSVLVPSPSASMPYNRTGFILEMHTNVIRDGVSS